MIIEFLIYAVILFAVIITLISNAQKKKKRKTVSSDGHVVPADEDLTCDTKYGHRHVPDQNGRRYIVHEEPEDGWVVLNGVKRRIKDCKDL